MLVMDLTHTSKESTCHMPKLSTCRLSLLLAGNTSEGVPLNPSLRPANKYYIQTWQTPNRSMDLKVCHVEVKRVQGTLRNSLLQLVSWKLLNTYLGQPLNITLLPSSWSGLVSQGKWIIIHSCSLFLFLILFSGRSFLYGALLGVLGCTWQQRIAQAHDARKDLRPFFSKS